MLKNRRILITGGLGFIGSHLISNLIPSNEILCFDNSYRGSNLQYLQKKFKDKFERKVKLVKGDIRNLEQLTNIVNEFEPEVVFHLAAIAGVRTIIERPLEGIKVNLIGSYNLLSAITEKSVEKVVYTSTSEVYGPAAYKLSENENTVQGSPYHSRWSYATSKLFAEHLFVNMEKEHGIPVSIGRLFNVYGSGQIGGGAIHHFVERAIKNKNIEVYGSGTEIRAWCYVDDCVRGLLLITEKGQGTYNIGNPYEALTTYALALKTKEEAKSKSKIVFKSFQPSAYTDIPIRVPNIDKIGKLGYKPRVNLSEGIQKTIKWYKTQITS